MSCTHEPPYPDPLAVPSQTAAAQACSLVGRDHPELGAHPKAVTLPEGKRTLIDRDWWSGLGPAQRAAVVSHERAHTIIGLDCPCESCADKVGGYMMRSWGFTDAAIGSAYGSLGVPRRRQSDGSTRDAARGALVGAQRAQQGLAAKGLLGTTARDVDRLRTQQAAVGVKTAASTLAPPASTLAPPASTLAPSSLPASSIPTPAPTGHAAAVTASLTPSETKAVASGVSLREVEHQREQTAPASTAASAAPELAAPAAAPPDTTAQAVKVQVIAGVITAIVLAIVLGGK